MLEIRYIKPKSAAMAGGWLGFTFGILSAIFLIVSVIFSQSQNDALLFLLFQPLIYGVIGLLLGWTMSFFYNFFARRFGGITIELLEKQIP